MLRSRGFKHAARAFLPTLLFAVAVGWAASGCFSVSEAVETGVESASAAAGEEVGEAIGKQLAPAVQLPAYGSAQWNQFMVSQAQVLFSYAFSAGGMWPGQATYEPGEWAEYRLRAAEDGEAALDTLERAFLKTTDDGNEWWRVSGVQEGESWIYEALVSPDRQEVLRLRAKDPKGNVGEVPVTEGTVYQPPRRLTEESVEGATTGTTTVDTPAGAFTARRVEYTGTGAGGTVTWLLADDVPGDIVRYRVEGSGGSAWTSTLIAYGDDATTQLDSY